MVVLVVVALGGFRLLDVSPGPAGMMGLACSTPPEGPEKVCAGACGSQGQSGRGPCSHVPTGKQHMPGREYRSAQALPGTKDSAGPGRVSISTRCQGVLGRRSGEGEGPVFVGTYSSTTAPCLHHMMLPRLAPCGPITRSARLKRLIWVFTS